MLRIKICFFSKVVLIALFFLILVLPHPIVVAEERLQYEEDGLHTVGEKDLKTTIVTKSINTGNYSNAESSTTVSPTAKGGEEKPDMLKPVEEELPEKTLDPLNSVELNGLQKRYASFIIPSSLVNAPREGASAIVVEKDSQTLWVYTSKNGEFIRILEIPCSTGERDGPKLVEGDKKTPEGIYFMKQIHEERFLAPIYGKRAFTTDYPNFLDRLLGKTGSAIWIHGTNKRLKPMDSNGCVAMNNDDILKLAPYIVLDETPLIVMDRVDYTSLEATITQRAALLDFLSRWIEALNSGSYLDYLFHYSSNYIPDVRWWAEWLQIRSRAAISGNPIAARFDHAGIYRHKDHFVVLLDFKVSSRYRTIAVGRRQLFIMPTATISTTLTGGVRAGGVFVAREVSPQRGAEASQREGDGISSSYSDNSYKIIGDLFQTTAMGLTVGNNHFITAAALLDRQYRVK